MVARVSGIAHDPAPGDEALSTAGKNGRRRLSGWLDTPRGLRRATSVSELRLLKYTVAHAPFAMSADWYPTWSGSKHNDPLEMQRSGR